MREDDKKKTKETRRQETVRGRVEYFVVSRKLATRQTRIALKLVTITEQHSLSPSFSRTQEHINPHPPSASLAKVLTAASIYKRRDNAPYHRHSREHGNHSSAYAECFVSKSPHSGKHPKCREGKVNSVVPSTYNARFRMGPRMREDDKKKTKETGRQETVRERVEYFVVSRKLATRQTRIALKLVTITELHPLSPSFSRTREPIHLCTPSASLAKVLTTTNIYKRRDNVPNAVILANAGTHSSAYAESFVSKSPYNDKHLQTKRPRLPLPSFSRTREPILPRSPRVSLAKVLTTTNTPNAERAR